MGDLERDLQRDETQIRVALSLLEEAALLRRGPDVPRAAQLRLAEDRPPDPGLRALCAAARLKPGQWLTVNLTEVARAAALSPYTLEAQLLTWADAGWIGCRFSGRDALLELLPAPPDAPARVKSLLERYETVAAQRVDEITAYARTSRCRHGYLNAYLGGRAIKRCTACDNCVGSAALDVAAGVAAACRALGLELADAKAEDYFVPGGTIATAKEFTRIMELGQPEQVYEALCRKTPYRKVLEKAWSNFEERGEAFRESFDRLVSGRISWT